MDDGKIMFCPRCGRENPLTAGYCNGCGFSLQEIHTVLGNNEGSAETPGSVMTGAAQISMAPAVPEVTEDPKKMYVRTTTLLPDGFGETPKIAAVSPPVVSQPEQANGPVLHHPLLPPQPGAVPEPASATMPARIRNPSAAVALSIIPGLGQVYNGMVVRGIILFAATVLGLFIYIVPGVCVWIYSICDAFLTSEKINRGEIAFSP